MNIVTWTYMGLIFTLWGSLCLKFFHEDVPNVFDNFFTYNYTIREHNTRSAQHLHIPLCVSNLTKTGIRYQGPIIWNNILKAEINPICSETSFKIMLKMSVQSNNKGVNYVIEFIFHYTCIYIYISKVTHLVLVLTQLRSLYWGSVWPTEVTFCDT